MNRLTVRRARRVFSDHKIKILSILIISLFFISATGYAIYSTNVSIGGSATIIPDDGPSEDTCQFNVEASLDFLDTWNSENRYSYRVDLTLTNNGSTDINGWEIQVGGPSDLHFVSGNATVLNGDGFLLLSNMAYNARIPAGGSITTDLILSTVESSLNIKYMSLGDCIIYKDDTVSSGDNMNSVTSVLLSSSTMNLKVGNSNTLTATKIPFLAPGNIVWSSSDPTVATVTSAGKVTGISEGTAIIRASVGSVSSSCTVNVKQGGAYDDLIKITFESPYYDNSSIQFKLTVKNVSNVSYSRLSFDIDLPEGATISFWSNPGFSADGNTLVLNMNGGRLDPDASVELTGNISLPAGTDASKYVKAEFDNINIIE